MRLTDIRRTNTTGIQYDGVGANALISDFIYDRGATFQEPAGLAGDQRLNLLLSGLAITSGNLEAITTGALIPER